MDLKPRTLEKLNVKFKNKPCTILLKGPLYRPITEAQAQELFVIVVEEITADGVFGTHFRTGMYTFFTWPNIVSIKEEVEMDLSNPEHVKIIQEYEKQTGQKILEPPAEEKVSMLSTPSPTPEPKPSVGEEATFVDIANLANLAKQTKKSFDLFEATKHLR